MKTGAYEKNRLEEKQRAMRTYKEKMGLDHKPVYFEEMPNEFDNDMPLYFKYNNTYYE